MYSGKRVYHTFHCPSNIEKSNMNQKHPLSLEFLRNMNMFSVREKLTEEELGMVQQFLQACEQERISPGQTLIEKGEARPYMYLLLSGRLNVFLEKSRPEPIAVLKTGESVGEISLIDRLPSTAYVIAQESCQVLALTLQDLMTLARIAPGIMINLLYQMVQRLRSGNIKISEEQEKQLLFEEKSIRDALTGLYNRSWLDQELPRIMQVCREHSRPFALCMVDVDHFKKYNDSMGHQAGDCALRSVASTLQQQLRDSDRVARYGGEEFTVFLPMTDRDKAYLVTERLRYAIEKTNIDDEKGAPLPSVTISIGFTLMRPTDDPNSLLERADRALYQAKHNGRNRAEFL